MTLLKGGLPWWLNGKESTSQCRRCGFNPWVRKIPLKKEMATHTSILAWKIPGWRSLAGYSSWGCKESDTTERLHFPFLSSKNPRDPCILPMC